jgi:hypothetical protein
MGLGHETMYVLTLRQQQVPTTEGATTMVATENVNEMRNEIVEWAMVSLRSTPYCFYVHMPGSHWSTTMTIGLRNSNLHFECSSNNAKSSMKPVGFRVVDDSDC